MKIAVDVMGGDNAPREIIKGALEAAELLNQKIVLVGDGDLIRQEIPDSQSNLISIVHAPEIISMSEPPAVAVRRKKNSSIVKATQLVRDGEAKAMVSAGNTGAVMAAGVLLLGAVEGIDRPAIAALLPNKKAKKTLLLDTGANVDCKPAHLLQFAILGYLYMKEVYGVKNPRVGLLNIGQEETKGNELTLATFLMLRQADINFIGNIEGCDIFEGDVDVVVCDGFVGNIVLKVGEGMFTALLDMIRGEEQNLSAKIGMAILAPTLRKLGRKLDYAEYGGAPLLGLNGVMIICHGRSKAKAITNAIRLAREFLELNLVSAIKNCLKDFKMEGESFFAK